MVWFVRPRSFFFVVPPAVAGPSRRRRANVIEKQLWFVRSIWFALRRSLSRAMQGGMSAGTRPVKRPRGNSLHGLRTALSDKIQCVGFFRPRRWRERSDRNQLGTTWFLQPAQFDLREDVPSVIRVTRAAICTRARKFMRGFLRFALGGCFVGRSRRRPYFLAMRTFLSVATT